MFQGGFIGYFCCLRWCLSPEHFNRSIQPSTATIYGQWRRLHRARGHVPSLLHMVGNGGHCE